MSVALRFRPSRFLFLVSAVAACGSEEQAGEPTFELDPAQVQAALENPIRTCQDQGLTCLGSAQDAQQAAACQTQVGTCLQGAAQSGSSTASAFRQCQDSARKCVTSGGSLTDCRTQFDACTGALAPAGDAGVPPAPASDAGVSLPGLPGGNVPRSDAGISLPGGNGFPAGDGGLSLPGLPGGNGLPSGDGGLSLPGLPGGGGAPGPGLPGGLGARVKCLEDMRTCVQTDPSKVNDCATQARACIAAAQP